MGGTYKRTRRCREKRADAGASASARFLKKEGIGRSGENKIERETGGDDIPQNLWSKLKRERAKNGLQNISKHGAGN